MPGSTVFNTSKYSAYCYLNASHILVSTAVLIRIFNSSPYSPITYTVTSEGFMISLPPMPDCIEKMLGTNSVPSFEQQRFIQEALIRPQRDLEDIQIKIKSFQKNLDDLFQESNEISKYVAPFQDLVSPFRRLPNEIISEIFLVCLPPSQDVRMDIHTAPLLLTRISGHTRRIALSTPGLWATIRVLLCVPSFPERNDGRNGDRYSAAKRVMSSRSCAVKEWVRRAGACQLSIFLDEVGADSSVEIIGEALDAIIAVADRWRMIKLDCSEYTFALLCAGLDNSKLSSLKSFALENIYNWADQDQCNMYNTSPFSFAPHLHVIRFGTRDADYLRYKINHQRLTHISLGSSAYPAPINRVSKMVASCPRLLSCQLHLGDEDEEQDDNSTPSVRHSSLQSLKISFDKDSWEEAWMEAPEPDILDIEIMGLNRLTYDASFYFIPLSKFVARAGQYITHLSLTNLDSPIEIRICVENCPGLVALEVHRTPDAPPVTGRAFHPQANYDWVEHIDSPWAMAGDHLLRLLSEHEDPEDAEAQPWCPNLKFLAYHVPSGAVNISVIKSFIQKKCLPSSISVRGGAIQQYTGLKSLSLIVDASEEDINLLWESVVEERLAGLEVAFRSNRRNHWVTWNANEEIAKRPNGWMWDDEPKY